MNTIEDYTKLCTHEQTRRAYKLGAPIKQLDIREAWDFADNNPQKYTKWIEKEVVLEIPTTQQMIGWLEEEKGCIIDITHYNLFSEIVYQFTFGMVERQFNTRAEAELAAINRVLNYLESLI